MCDYAFVVDHQAMLEDGYTEAELPFKMSNYKAIPRSFDFITGAMMLPLLECCSAAKNFGPDVSTEVLIYGAGPMGLGVAVFIRKMGVKSLTVIDYSDVRLGMVKKAAQADQVIANKPVDIPVIWTRMWGKGKVFYSSIGHTADLMAQEPVKTIMRRGFLWAAR